MYRIYNKNLNGFSLSGWDCQRYYKEAKEAHLNKNDARYGDKLVKMKRIKTGVNLRLKFYFRYHWYWKPHYSFKFNTYFHWLFFMIWVDAEYDDIIDKVEKDDLAESINGFCA